MSIAQAASPSQSLYLPLPARVESVLQLSPLENLYDVHFLDGHLLDHQPGQFVQVSLLGIGECPISVCSSPTRGDPFQLCIRKAGNVTNRIHDLSRGDVIGIRGPLGRGFDVKALHGHNILIVAGGCGLAPVRSLIQYIMDERARFGSFHVLYGAKSPEDLLFKSDLNSWQSSSEIDLHVTVDQGSHDWLGNVGLVTTLFSSFPSLSPTRTAAVIVGPPIMFKFVLEEVRALQIPEDKIYCSLERHMKCGIGKCGHCQVNALYACTDGPVLTVAELQGIPEAFA